MRIGAVLEQLQNDFPDVSISKIRFLEAQGLVLPQRTPAGYRVYTPADVERLRYILTAQRDRFWPLKVIGEALDALDRGLDLSPEGVDSAGPKPAPPPKDADVPPVAELLRTSRVRLTRAELADSAGCGVATVDSLQEYGLIHPDATGHFGTADAQIAAAAGALTAFGLEPRHLRAFRAAADREVGLVEQALATHNDPGDRQRAAAEIAHACLQLHAALVKAGLRRG